MSNSNGSSPHPEDEMFANNRNPQETETGDFLSELDLYRLWGIFRRNLLLLMFLVSVCLAGGYVYLRYTKPVFQSGSSLRLSMQQNASILGINGIPGMANPDAGSGLLGEIEFLRSPLLHEDIINRVGLGVSYFSKGKILDEERYKASPFTVESLIFNEWAYDTPFNLKILSDKEFTLSYLIGKNEHKSTHRFGEPVETPDFRFLIRLKTAFSPDLGSLPFYFTVNSRSFLENYLQKNLTVTILNPSANVIGIAFKEFNPHKARDIVNAVDSVYLQKTKSSKNESNEQKIHFMNQQLGIITDSLDRYETYLQNFTVREKTVNVDNEVSKIITKLEEMVEQKLTLGSQLAQLHSLQEVLQKNEKLSDFQLLILGAEDPQLSNLVAQMLKLQQERDILAGSAKETTFALRTKDRDLQKAKNTLTLFLQHRLHLLDVKMEQINRRIAGMESNFSTLPGKGGVYARLQRMKNLYEKFYLQMMDRKAEVGISQAGIIADFVILSPANLPRTPISPNQLFIYAICAGVGLVLCLGVVGGKYVLHNTLSNQRDLERLTDAPVLGVIPAYLKEKMPVSRLIVDKFPKASISEALRSVRTNMDFVMSNRKKKKIISVTSTISGEGKTFVSMNLAGIIALSQSKVVILDLDMRKPKLHLAFEVDNSLGISGILIGKQKWEDCIRHTSIPTLDFITAGSTPPNPAELILRPEYDELIEQLHQHYDVIVIDTPPVGLVTDGILVMRKADLPVYVVRADYSKRSFVRNINNLFENQGFNRLTLILNAYRGGGGYGYEYVHNYGGYNYYGEEEEEKTLLKKLIGKRKK
jgi:tyrosine-protein kinase Etk/Wzc